MPTLQRDIDIKGVEKRGVDVRDATRQTRYDFALMFKALGDPTRLRIFEFLRESCCPVTVEETGDVRATTGPTVGEVCCNVTGATTVTSSVSFHLKELRLAGLVTVERRGKYQICGINQDAVAALTAFFGGAGIPEESSDPQGGQSYGLR